MINHMNTNPTDSLHGAIAECLRPFRRGFERRFNRFRDGYEGLLERMIDRRRAFVTVSSPSRSVR